MRVAIKCGLPFKTGAGRVSEVSVVGIRVTLIPVVVRPAS